MLGRGKGQPVICGSGMSVKLFCEENRIPEYLRLTALLAINITWSVVLLFALEKEEFEDH